MTVSDQIIQVLDKLCEKFGIVVDWTSQNAITYFTLLCEKLIKYESIMSGLTILANVGVLILSFIIIRLAWRYYNEEDEDLGMGLLIISVLTSAAIDTWMVITLIDNIKELIQCIVFPEMFIFEYVSKLVSTM